MSLWLRMVSLIRVKNHGYGELAYYLVSTELQGTLPRLPPYLPTTDHGEKEPPLGHPAKTPLFTLYHSSHPQVTTYDILRPTEY